MSFIYSTPGKININGPKILQFAQTHSLKRIQLL